MEILDRRRLARTDQRRLAVRAAGRGWGVSEQLNAAIERLKQINAGMAFDKVYGGSSDDYGHDYSEDISNVIGHYFEELSRRDAERAERALPITAEWCLANGAAWNNHRAVAWWRILDNARLEFNAANGVAMIVGDGWSYFDNITTRGQLLDLLKALRGGT